LGQGAPRDLVPRGEIRPARARRRCRSRRCAAHEGGRMKKVLAAIAAGAMLGVGAASLAKLPPPPPKSDTEKKAEADKAAASKAIGDKVHLVASVTRLAPGPEHAFHVHEAADCSSADGMSAKGHFNPYGKPHGSPASTERHAGDMPSLKADASGNAKVDTTLD